MNSTVQHYEFTNARIITDREWKRGKRLPRHSWLRSTNDDTPAALRIVLVHLATWRIYFLRRRTLTRQWCGIIERRWLAFDTLLISAKIPSHVENVSGSTKVATHDADATCRLEESTTAFVIACGENDCRQRNSNVSLRTLLFFFFRRSPIVFQCSSLFPTEFYSINAPSRRNIIIELSHSVNRSLLSVHHI